MIPEKIRRKKELSEACRKIEKLYHNYGIDTSNMTDEELEAIADTYIRLKKDLDTDLAQSEIHKDKFGEELI